MRSLIVLLLVAGCVEQTPRAHVWLDIEVDDGNQPFYLTAARAWEALGFTVDTQTDGSPPCAASRGAGCEVQIYLARPDDLIATRGVSALSLIDEHQVAIDASVVGGQLRIAVAHEVGHVLLFTREHAQGLAIMAGTWSEVTDGDRELACRVASICD